MPLRFRPSVAALLIGVLAAGAAAQEKTKVVQGKKARKHVLPKDPKAAVIVLRYQGGFTPPRKTDDADLTIRADGTVILGAPFGTKKRIETKIDAKGLQALLRFLLDEQELGKFDAKEIAEAIKKAGGMRLVVADAPTTVVQVHADGTKREAKYYALGMMARQFPKIKSLTQLETVRKHLERFRSTIYAGGDKGLAKHLALANKELKKKHPDAPPLKEAALQSAWQYANDRTYVSFQRQEKLEGGKTRFISVSINYPAKGEPMVTARMNVIVKE